MDVNPFLVPPCTHFNSQSATILKDGVVQTVFKRVVSAAEETSMNSASIILYLCVLGKLA